MQLLHVLHMYSLRLAPTMSHIPLVYSIAISLGNWSCMSRKGGTGGGGLVRPESENSMAMYGQAVKTPQ